MTGIVATMPLYARKINNYEADATSGTLWTSTTTFRVTVPAGKRWFVIGGASSRTVSATQIVRAYDAAGKMLHTLDNQAATTGIAGWPNSFASAGIYGGGLMIPLDPGEYVEYTFGVAQNTSAYANCVVFEVNM